MVSVQIEGTCGIWLSLGSVQVVEEAAVAAARTMGQITFAASGVTEGSLPKGVRFFGNGVRVNSLEMTYATRSLRFVDSIHLSRRPDVKVRLF